MKYPSTKATQNHGSKGRGMGGHQDRTGGRGHVGSKASIDPYAPQKAVDSRSAKKC